MAMCLSDVAQDFLGEVDGRMAGYYQFSICYACLTLTICFSYHLGPTSHWIQRMIGILHLLCPIVKSY